MLKTHKVQLDPNNKQATQFAQHCGYARLSYNAGLHEFKNGLDGSAWLTLSDTKRVFNSKKFEAYEWAQRLVPKRLQERYPRPLRRNSPVEVKSEPISQI